MIYCMKVLGKELLESERFLDKELFLEKNVPFHIWL